MAVQTLSNINSDKPWLRSNQWWGDKDAFMTHLKREAILPKL